MDLFPEEEIVPFDADAARLAADIYCSLPRPRGREIDIAIAACALSQGAAFATLNRGDFEDIPKVVLI